MDAEQLSSLVGDLYDTALDPSQADRLGAILCQAMGVGSCIMFLTEHPSGRMIELVSSTPNFDAAARRDYAAHYHAQNPWYLTAVERTPPYVARGEELVDYRTFERTEFCADWCSRMDIFHMIGGVVPVRSGVVVGSGIHKTRRQGAFSEPEKHRYALLMRHLARSLQVADRISVSRSGAAIDRAVLHGLAVGVMVLDGERRIIQANAVAERLLRNLRWISARQGIVQPVHPGDRDEFDKRVAGAAGAGNGLGTGGLMRLRDPVEQELAVLIAPFRSPLGGRLDTRLATIVFTDPDSRTTPPQSDIARALGVSPAEAELVWMLAKGATLVEAAKRLGRSVNTAKTQLKSVFQKTGARRQADVVERISRNPVLQLSARWKEQEPDVE